MSTVVYRTALPQDANALASLRAAFLKEASPDAPVEDALLESLKSYFAQALASGDFAAVLAIVNGEIIATSGMVELRNPPSQHNPFGRSGYIMNMYTLPAWRRQGLAATILQKLLELAAQRGYRRVSLHALPGAQTIYTRAGFEAVDNEMRRNLPG